MPDARARLERDLTCCGRAGDLEPLITGCTVHGARAERGTLREGVERCGEEAGRPRVGAEEEPCAGVARGVLRV